MTTPTHRAAPYIIIITGPTASGKSTFSEKLSEKLPVEIINADARQIYTALSIGTAKPNLARTSVPHHLFDVHAKPAEYTVAAWRKDAVRLIDEITARGRVPVLVGGSLFYIKSLFFPPLECNVADGEQERVAYLLRNKDIDQWKLLESIDPVRASRIHPHDTYRISRSLEIWQRTGKKPSSLAPTYAPKFHARIICICPEREVLYDRINRRTHTMLDEEHPGGGWISEAQSLLGTPWEKFTKKIGVIGYEEIFAWIRAKKRPEDLPHLIEKIQTRTRNYARRQVTFWKSFKRILKKNENCLPFLCKIQTYNVTNEEMILQAVQTIKNDVALYAKSPKDEK